LAGQVDPPAIHSRLGTSNDCNWRILAINVVAAFLGKPNRPWSMCEENTADLHYRGDFDEDEQV
jgi:hypothetical protein